MHEQNLAQVLLKQYGVIVFFFSNYSNKIWKTKNKHEVNSEFLS